MPFLPHQPYVSLFESSAEVPRFVSSYRYWEDEAKIILGGYDVQAIQRLIRYRLFDDQNLPRMVLQNRNENIVMGFLLDLVAPQEEAFVKGFLQNQQVAEIIRRSRMASVPLLPWAWLPSWQDSDSDPEAIATAIDAESHLQFSRVAFEEWVRYSIGYRTTSVEWFLQQHTNLFIHLLTYLRGFPDEIEKYIKVEKVRLTKISVWVFKQANRLA